MKLIICCLGLAGLLAALPAEAADFWDACIQQCHAVQARGWGGDCSHCGSRPVTRVQVIRKEITPNPSYGGGYSGGSSSYSPASSDGGGNAAAMAELADTVTQAFGVLDKMFGSRGSAPPPQRQFSAEDRARGYALIEAPRATNRAHAQGDAELSRLKDDSWYSLSAVSGRLDRAASAKAVRKCYYSDIKDGDGQAVHYRWTEQELRDREEYARSNEDTSWMAPLKEEPCPQDEPRPVADEREGEKTAVLEIPDLPKPSEAPRGEKPESLAPSSKAQTAPPPRSVARVERVVAAKERTVEKRREQVAALDFKIAEVKDARKTWDELHRSAESAVKVAAPDKQPEKRSLLAMIEAQEKRTEALSVKLGKSRDAASAGLKDAESALARAKSQARDAMRDKRKLEDFDRDNPDADDRSADDAAEAPPEPQDAVAYAPSVHIWRPSSDSPDFVVEAQKKVADASVPYPGAKIELSWPGSSREISADELGKARVDPGAVYETWPNDADRVQIKARVENATFALTVTRAEIGQHMAGAAEVLLEQAEQDMRQKNFGEAARKCWRSLALHPTEKGVQSWVSAVTAQSSGGRALDAYRTALMRFAKDPQSRAGFKHRAAEAARQVSPAPEVASAARDQWARGLKAFKASDSPNAIVSEEVASAMAPWWHEPYFALANVYAYLAVHNSFVFATAAIENFDLFAETAPAADERRGDAKAQRDRLSRIKKLLD